MNACSKASIKVHPLHFIPQISPTTSLWRKSGRKVFLEAATWGSDHFLVSSSVLPGEVPKYSHVLLIKSPAELNVALEIGPQFSSLHLWGSLRIDMFWPARVHMKPFQNVRGGSLHA